MRLFIAFKVPAEAMHELQKQISFEGIKLVKDFHCTLKFLGEVDEDKVGDIIKKLRSISFQKIDARFGKIGTFPHVIWIGLLPEDEICTLQQQIDDALVSFFPKNERFAPHVTLGRAQSIKADNNIQHALKNKKTPPAAFAIDEFCLIRSELQQSGPVYSIIERFMCLPSH